MVKIDKEHIQSIPEENLRGLKIENRTFYFGSINEKALYIISLALYPGIGKNEGKHKKLEREEKHLKRCRIKNRGVFGVF